MPRKAAASPPGDVVDQIKREISAPGFLVDLTAWADRQCGRLLALENRVDPHKATDLVNAAIVATCDGVRVWDPNARTLRRHLEQTINSRLWHECERLRRRRHITLDTASVDDSQDECAVDVEMSLRTEDPRTRPDGRLAQRQVRARVFHSLRAQAAGDDELLAFLDAYEAGHTREGEAMARLNLTERGFDNIVRRFRTLRKHIPDALRRDALDMIANDGGPLAATVARRQGRIVEILADDTASNDSRDAVSLSSDGEDDESEAATE